MNIQLLILFSVVTCFQACSAFQPVAFSVGLTRHVTADPESRIVYNVIFTNVGGGYDRSTGRFTCRTPGLYQFMFHGLSQEDKGIYLSLHHNYRAVVTAYSSANYKFTGGSNSVILRLSAEDVVYITTQGKTSLYGKIDQIYATFSGFLLSEIEENYVSGPPPPPNSSNCTCTP